MVGLSWQVFWQCQAGLAQGTGTPDAPLFDMKQMPCKILKTTEAEADHEMPVTVPILCPHRAFAHLFQNHRSNFDKKMFGGPFDPLVLEAFCREVVHRKDPRTANHPMCTQPHPPTHPPTPLSARVSAREACAERRSMTAHAR